MSYTVRPSSSADFAEILTLVEHNYMLEEPIARSWLANRGGHFTQVELQAMKDSLKTVIESQHSLVACTQDNTIVGILVLIPNTTTSTTTTSSGPMAELDTAVGTILQSFGFHERFPDARNVVKLRMLTVHREHRGRGVSTLLLKKGIQWAKEMGVDLLWSFFNAHASRRAAERCGFEVFHEYDLLEYRDNGGRSVFGFIEEHVAYAMAYMVNK